jgi:DNA-binding response OmpR family regulator
MCVCTQSEAVTARCQIKRRPACPVRGRNVVSVIGLSATGTSSKLAHRALLVCGTPSAADSLRGVLVEQGFRVDAASDADSAVRRAPGVDVIVLELSLPEADSIELCRALRSATDAYIVAVGGRQSELDVVLSLSVGADDFITEPVKTAEFVARIRAMLRRPRNLGNAPAVLRVADLEIDTGARDVRIGDEPIELSNLEFDLLETLARNAKLTLSREQLLRQVWGPNWFGDDHVIDVHISNLRRKLHDDPQAPKYIRTVRGFGFRIQSPEL